MKILGAFFMITIFIILPFVLLQLFVLPALNSLKNTYSNADSISYTIVSN